MLGQDFFGAFCQNETTVM